jgi:uncharacterized protein (TIGR02145 family)
VVSLTTVEASNRTAFSATSGGVISDDGGAEIAARGVCWSTNPNPTIENDKTEDGAGIGSFTSDLTGLTADTTYYVRAYASNALGTWYGNEQTFVTQELGTVTDIDGNSYGYQSYGDQAWTLENASVETYRDGTSIPQVTAPTAWSNLPTGAWCYYDNDPTQGKLYNWYAVMGIHDTDPDTPNKEFAPAGWHVPTDAEWTRLENHLIANGFNYDQSTTGDKIAKAMASTTGWRSSTTTGAVGNDQSSNNRSGFNAFPEGIRTNNGSFVNEGYGAIFWSSTEYSANSAWGRLLSTNYSNLARGYYGKQNGFSVRFVRD